MRLLHLNEDTFANKASRNRFKRVDATVVIQKYNEGLGVTYMELIPEIRFQIWIPDLKKPMYRRFGEVHSSKYAYFDILPV